MFISIQQLHFLFKLRIFYYISGGNLNWQIYLEGKLEIYIKNSVSIYGLSPSIWYLENSKPEKNRDTISMVSFMYYWII